MRIHSITPFNIYNLKQNKQEQNKPVTQNYAYNPIAYNDLTFTARLFRTPENFYAQPFNKNGMPDTMKDYLNADYEDRQKMPPAQMLKLVFDDINETKNLEQVRRHFSDEPLFENLTDTPNKKARTGILAEIDLMKEDGKTLFKNGKDNLGHYIVKKIYTEAKTLKEINEDFKKDISVHYKDLSPIGYETLRAYGIKFPNNSFWKSLTATREEFPYEYKPRKPIEHHIGGGAVQKQTSSSSFKPRNRFENVKDWEVNKLTGALTDGNGSVLETRKRLKQSGIKDEASLNFVAKYMGEINSVVLEKLHVSPEMKEFFEDYDNLSKSQKQKFTAYWQDSDRRELRSTIMKDTIRLFFDAYGVDGQNDEFKELLNYARSIKPSRLAQQAEHSRIQAEYDEMFAELDEQDKLKSETVEQNPAQEKSFDEILEKTKKDYNVGSYVFDTELGEVVILSKLNEALDESIKKQLNFMPEQFVNKFARFVNSSPIADESYILTRLLDEQGIKLPQDDRLITNNELIIKNIQLYDEYCEKYKNDARALQQGLSDCCMKFSNEEASRQVFKLSLFEFSTLYDSFPNVIKEKMLSEKSFINDKYNDYKRPLSDSEVRKIYISVQDLLRNYDIANSIFIGYDGYDEFGTVFYSVSKYINNKNFSKENFRKTIINYIKEYGGSARFFLDKNVSNSLKQAKLEQFLLSYCNDRPGELLAYAAIDKEGVEYVKMHSPDFYRIISKNLHSNRMYLGDFYDKQ